MDNAPEQVTKVTNVTSDEFKEVFTDAFGLEYNFFTFVLHCGRFLSTEEGFINCKIVDIAFSPEQAKALLGLLSARVADYEQRVGPIRVPNSPDKKPTIVVPSKRIIS